MAAKLRGLPASGAGRAVTRGRNYTAFRSGYRVRHGGGWRTFAALSTLGAIAIGASETILTPTSRLHLGARALLRGADRRRLPAHVAGRRNDRRRRHSTMPGLLSVAIVRRLLLSPLSGLLEKAFATGESRPATLRLLSTLCVDNSTTFMAGYKVHPGHLESNDTVDT
jgi:hypothetical protein